MMMMISTDLSTWVVGFLVLLLWFHDAKRPSSSSSTVLAASDDQLEKYYIEWDDLTVNEYEINGNGTRKRLEIRNQEKSPSRVIVVDKNGGGDSLTVQGAVDLVPRHNRLRHKIFILPGVYREKVHVPKWKPYVSFIGMENRSSETVITWHDKASDKKANGSVEIGTFDSASVTVDSDYFGAREVTFENSVVAVPGTNDMQAVALRLKGDKAWLYKVRILGTQDTLLDESGLHYYQECYIQGSVDFIFGNAKSYYQDCILHSVAPEYGAIAANHRDYPDEDTGFSFVNCQVRGSGKVLLGRAWGNYSKVVYSSCDFDDIILPEGWSDWRNTGNDRKVEFGEFNCTGKGADRSKRVEWSYSLDFFQAWPYLTPLFIDGYQWLSLER
ncbi:OLC1v1022526C2 [Oldenlandia corymbosa var. corymbosa]|nr:OLC1v1022526C2 [Oldenlandia corymbosa var. corymbosa]